MEAISREFKVALPWELLYADDLAVSKGMRVNKNKTKVMKSGERQKVRQGCKMAMWGLL